EVSLVLDLEIVLFCTTKNPVVKGGVQMDLLLQLFFIFKQKTAYEIGLGIPAEPLFRSVRFQTALASIKLIQASAVLDLTEDDFDFLTSNKVWIATDRSRARRCVEACVYGTLDFVGYPRFPAPVEFIAAVIAYYVHP